MVFRDAPERAAAAVPDAPSSGARRRHDFIKRLFDVVVASLALVLLSPLLAAVALLVLVAFGRPVLFRHTRPGLHGELFELVKFRTMHHVDPSRGRVTDADRLTPVGRWLRATSLDELPELWNVLRGEMSLVGPRPHLVRYLDLYTNEQARRHGVRPGITGLAQVRGRNTLSWEDKFAYDVEYVDSRSFALDLRILAETVRVVLRREGITAPGSATWHEWQGPTHPIQATAEGAHSSPAAAAADPAPTNGRGHSCHDR
ncbi:sugar transferase [Micromonospora sp. KC606]|uniref:sugar transferase n=1 Tax=Micromonospora sp. KC606 TaxID=2530379 RepID=UPI00104C9499|nr:sugar transferase [Micromonospora sp. KC606]TDC85171.1 sugar transferase [Micromonospora sp. KC606]